MPGPLWRIRDRRSFRALRADGARRRSGPLVVTALHDGAETDAPRVAFAISRAVGPAVVRSRLRRQLRAHARALDLPAGAYLVGVAPAAAGLSGHELRSHFEQAVR
ncbi:MAG: ribonuclease protein component [Acidimicrobiaceae bacterium]|jgi:ribonuclease P protein component